MSIMNVTSSIYTSGWNASQAGAVKTARKTDKNKSFQTRLQDSFTRTAANSAAQSVGVGERTEPALLKRDDPKIQEVLGKMTDGKTPLTKEQLEYLTKKYQATDMTGAEYEAFTQDLRAMGILSDIECEVVDGQARLARMSDYQVTEDRPNVIHTEKRMGCGVNFSDGWGGNALAWTQYHSSARSYYGEIGDYDINWNASVFTVVHSVLAQMQEAAGSSVSDEDTFHFALDSNAGVENPVLIRDDPQVQHVLDKMVDNKAPLPMKYLKYLTEKYDATDMSGDEYDAFLNDLKQMGILDQTECLVVGGEMRWSSLYTTQHSPKDIHTEPRMGFGENFSQGWGGNALAWTKYQSSWKCYYDEIGDYDMNWNGAVFTVVHSILAQMDAAEHSLSKAV